MIFINLDKFWCSVLTWNKLGKNIRTNISPSRKGKLLNDTLHTGPFCGLRHKGSIMQVPSVGYGGPMVGGENEYERRQNIGGVGLIGARGSIDDGSGGGSAHPVFHTGP